MKMTFEIKLEKIDIVILSYAKNKELYQTTINCLDTLFQSNGKEMFNVIVVESNKEVTYPEYPIALMHIDEPFNYNRFSNIAISLGESKYIGIFNNDLEFDKDWYIQLMKYGFDSMSPKSLTSPLQSEFNNITMGYRTARELSGWAIVMKRDVWNKIGKLDESFTFWCSDDVYREQLKKHSIEHYLIPTSIVNHLEGGSNTLKTIHGQENTNLTHKQLDLFRQKYK